MLIKMNSSLELNESFWNESIPMGSFPRQWGWWMKQTLTPLIVLVGIVGNTLSFLVMKSSSGLRQKSYSHYLCALAFFDNLTLIGRQIALVDEITTNAGSPGLFTTFNDAACKIYNFSEHVCYMMSSWLIVVMAFERIVAIYFPFKKRTVCRPIIAVILIVSILVIASYTQVFRLIMIRADGGVCVSEEEYRITFVMLHTYFYQITLTFVLPVCLVLVCNSMVLYKVNKIRKAIQDENSTTNRLTRYHNHSYKTTFMLLTISFVYVICVLPGIVVTVTFLVVWAVHGVDSVGFLHTLKPYGDAFEVLFVMNYGVNFFIYVFSGRAFRREFLDLLRGRRMRFYSSTRTRDSHVR